MNRLARALLAALALAAWRGYPAEEAPDLGPRLAGWTYRTAARPLSDEYADPGGRLTDGKAGREGPGALAIWQGGTIVFDLDLARPCRVRAARVFQHRHNLNYQLDHLRVSVRRGGAWEERARVPGFVGPTTSMDFVHVLDLGNVVTDAVRLEFVGAQVLSLSEIELFGVPAPPGAQDTGAFAEVPFREDPSPHVREEDLDRDGQPEVVLENGLVRAIFTPAAGGICRSLRLKPSGVELVWSRESGYGLLRDQLWQPQYDFAGRVYFHRLDGSADQAAVELWTTGSGGMMSFTEVRKRVTLDRGSPLLRVHYTLTNEASSQTDYEYGFWSHNWLGQAGAVNTYTFPTTEGVKAFTLDPERARRSDEGWYRNPARGWTAVASDQGHGLVMTMPCRYLNLFYHWHGAGALAATHEWRLNLIEIKAGARLEMDVTLIPFSGLTRVDGLADGVLGQIDAVPEGDALAVNARFLAPPGLTPRRTVRLVLTSGDGVPVAELGTVDFEPGAAAAMATRAAGLAAGGYVVRAEVLREGAPAGTFEVPATLGGARWQYRVEPEAERVGRAEAGSGARPGHEISTEVVTPHVPWARPFAGGRIRALVLMDDMNCREAVELAQRLDLDLDYVKFRTTLARELLYQGDLSILTLEAAQKALLERLRTRSYDVFVLAGFRWDFHFTPEIRETLLEKVREGAGLFLIQPDGFDEKAAAELPAAGVARAGNAGRNMNRWERWAPAGDHPLTAGLDWGRFPVTRMHEYAVPPQGEVIATAGRNREPLITLGTLGRGRVVCAAWDTLTHELSYRGYSALTPILGYRGGWLRPEFASLPAGYQEWWYALLTRLTAWAAGRDTGVSIAAAPPAEGALAGAEIPAIRVSVRSGRALPGARVTAVWFNAQGDRRDAPPAPAPLAAGETEILLRPDPAALTHGANTVCFTVRDPDDGALAWGFSTLTLRAPASIASLEAAPDTLLPAGGVWQEDGPVETRAFTPERPAALTLKLAAPAPGPLAVEFVAADSDGRELARTRREVAAGADSVTAELEPLLLTEQGIEITAALRRGDQTWDLRRLRLVAYRPRVWNRFWYTSWGGNWLWRSEYLFDTVSRLARDFGVDVSFEGTTELGTGKVRSQAYWGINHSWLGLLSYLGRGVPDFMDTALAEKAAQYARTRDKAALVRTPCLVDPQWREAVRTSLLERVNSTLPAGGACDYCMGDEMSLTSYTRFHDYDWAPASLADFRRWLRERYPALEALNAAWGTAHARWEDVVPLTREEAREAANPAPWFEFRTYMNDQLADFFRFVQETIRSADPNARCGLSGTQSPEAANGMDWWKLAFAFSYYHSYNTSWSNEMRRSFQRAGGAEQSPYFSGYSVVNPAAEYNLWWCLFHDCRGISAWCTSLFFYGDLSATESGRDTRGHLEVLRRGVWRLLRGAVRQHDGIALYYSMPSIIAGALTGDEARVNAARDAWVKLIEDSGLQYEFVAADQVAAGLLRQGDFKVVILPFTVALSAREAAELRAFAERGGVLIATRPVGVRDELGRPQSPGLLDALFGAGVEGASPAVEPVVKLTEPLAGLPAGAEIRIPVAVSGIALRGGQALATAGEGKVPALIRGSSGRTLLLNLDLTHFEQERRFHSPTEKQLRAIVADALAAAGVRPVYPVSLASGQPSHVEVVRYRAEGVEYLCLLNAGDTADVATIPLGAPRVVCDVRSGSARGAAETLTVPIEPRCARLFSLTDAPWPAPSLAAPASVPRAAESAAGWRRGGDLAFTVGRTGASPARQLVRVTVTDAAGRSRGELSQTVWVADAPVPSRLPLRLNDPPGVWTLSAVDVASGARADAAVDVR